MTQPQSAMPRLVLMTADTVGGVWHYAVQLADGLARRGIRTVLATMGRAPTATQLDAAAAVPGLLHVHGEYRLEWMPGAEADVERAGGWLLELERQHAPDIVHLNGYCHAALPFAAPKLVVAHSCVRSWWRAVHGVDAPPEWAAYGAGVARGLRAADAVVAPTAAFLTEIEAIYGPLPNAGVIHNGRDPDAFRSAAEKEPIVLAAGRLWDQAKNVAALDAVAADLPWPVHVAGDDQGPDGPAGMVANLQPLGLLSEAELARAMAKATAFALPARYEPFGLAVLEAALSGCALVLGNIPTLRELWNGAALFVRPDDHAALREALSGLARNPQLCVALGTAARRRAERYTAARTVDAVAALYSALLERRTAPFGHALPVNSNPSRNPAACAS